MQSTIRGAKHRNITHAIPAFTHCHAGIQQWERNEDTLRQVLK